MLNPFYGINCDRCEEAFGISPEEGLEDAIREANKNGWSLDEEGTGICPNCMKKLQHTYYCEESK